MIRKNIILGCFILFISMVLPASLFAKNSNEQETIDNALQNTVTFLQGNDFRSALKTIEELLKVQKDFQAGWVVRGDILNILAGRGGREKEISLMSTSAQRNINGYRDEVVKRISALHNPAPTNKVPNIVLSLPDYEKYYLLADLHNGRMYVLENPKSSETTKILSDMYISQGFNGAEKNIEGDSKTPVGVYKISNFIPREKLPTLYGEGAFPLNYPNTWDKLLGKTGSGIWIHGVQNDIYSRPPLASNGCIVVSNQDLIGLKRSLMDSAFKNVSPTTIVVTDIVEWVKPESLLKLRQELEGAIEAWRSDWSDINTAKYLSHYANDFSSDRGDDLTAWREHKTRVNASKSNITVSVKNLSLFLYPKTKDVYLVRFKQGYQSNNFSHVMQKEQYWRKTNNNWKIIYEGRAK